jgi:sporulation protein YlmC with PRC-barrel domain
MTMDLIRDVLDKQLLDRTNTKIGKVDGLVATIGEGQPRVVAIEVGASTLARRSGFARVMLRIFGSHDREAFRIPWSKVKDVGVDIEVDLAMEETAMNEWHDWVRRKVLRHIPGT